MAVRSRRQVSRTSTASVEASASSSKSRSLSSESLARFNSKLCPSGATRDASPVSWKRLTKRSPWLSLLKPHQLTGTEAIVSIDGFAALFAQRSGKTWVTGAVLEVEREVTHDVLLVGPLTNLKSTWVKFLSEKIPWYSVHLDLESYQTQAKRDEAWEAISLEKSHRILLLNYEAVTPLVKKLRKVKWDRLVYDEAQRLKNRTSRSSRDAMLLARSSKRRLALTGTPMDLDPKDLWAIMRFVDESVFGSNWKEFGEEYLVQAHLDPEAMKKGVIARKKEILRFQIAQRKAPMREDRIGRFTRRIRKHVMRISKQDAGLDPAVVTPVYFDLDPPEDRLYRSMEKQMLLKVNNTTIKAPLKITQIGKLQQITGGHIKDEDGDTHRIGTSKRRMMRQHMRDNLPQGQPFVVFCKYVEEVHMLHRVLTRAGYGEGAKLWGKVKDIKTDPRRTKMLTDFQEGRYGFMVCQQKTGGVGVDLYRARWFYVYSMGHSYIDFDQMLSRGDFLLQESSARFFILMARLSIDTDIFSAVSRKQSITEQFYDRLNTARKGQDYGEGKDQGSSEESPQGRGGRVQVRREGPGRKAGH